MIKKYLSLIYIIFFINITHYQTVNSAGPKSKGDQDLSFLNAKNSNFKKGLDAIKQAKKYKTKGKVQKAEDRFNDCIKFFIAANNESPNEPDILYYLGFSYKNVRDIIMAEIYYEQGLEIDPRHVNINKNLAELYIETNRVHKAKERLKSLENCNCEEYKELNFLISKY